jgi:hypothetical protein
VSGTWPDHPGDLSRLVGPPELVAANVVSYVGATGDARSASGVLYLAVPFELRLDEQGVDVALDAPAGVPDRVRVDGGWRAAVPEAVAVARDRVRDALPDRYVRWLAVRSAMPRDEPLREAPEVTTLDDVLVLLRERFGGVMSEPVPVPDDGEDMVRTVLYDTFVVTTGLERPRGNFVRGLRLSSRFGLGGLPGEPMWGGTTPGSIRRAYRVLDEYCRARLDLPPRADDEEIP